MSNFDDQMDKMKKEAGIKWKQAKQAWDKNVQPGLDKAVEKARPAVDKAGKAIEGAMDSVSDALRPAAEKVEQVASDIGKDPDMQKAKEKAGQAVDKAGEAFDDVAQKARPTVHKMGDALSQLMEKMQPAIDKAKTAFGNVAESAAYASAKVGMPDRYKGVAEGIHARCQFIEEDIEESNLSEETKKALGGELKSIVHEFELRMYGVLKAKDMDSKLEELRIEIFGKNNQLSALLKSIGQYPAEDRKSIGQVINATRSDLEAIYDDIKTMVEDEQGAAAQESERLDVTLPGKPATIGTVHPLTRVFEELCEIFIGMGFTVKDGPEIELDEYNFDKLNLPKDHPARDMQDTFYIEEGEVVLRTHTSPVQVRTMLNEKPPIRILSPGRVYRSDDIDATHSPIFHQMEGLVVDKGISMAHLKGILDEFASRFFGEDIKVRLRPSFFPFTEPSAEVDLTCVACRGEGCSVCKHTGWIEVLGCGMVHPNVLRNCGIDPEEYSGLAFGMGLDRIANLKYESNDIRLIYENDVRFLEQF